MSGKAPTDRAWPLRRAAALVLGVATLTLVSSRILRSMPASGLSAANQALVILAAFSAAYALELGAVWLVARRQGGRLAESTALVPAPPAMEFTHAVGAAVALRIVALVYSAVMLARGWTLPGWDANPLKYFPQTALGTFALVAIVVVAAPVVEETVFRGVLLPSLAERYGERWAVALSALVFSAMHLNPFTFLPVLVVGWVLARLFLRTKSLWVPIVCHAAFNGIGLIVVLFVRGSGVV